MLGERVARVKDTVSAGARLENACKEVASTAHDTAVDGCRRGACLQVLYEWQIREVILHEQTALRSSRLLDVHVCLARRRGGGGFIGAPHDEYAMGAAGTGIFMLNLAQVTGKAAWREKAVQMA